MFALPAFLSSKFGIHLIATIPHGLFMKRHFVGFHHEDSKNTKILVIGRWK